NLLTQVGQLHAHCGDDQFMGMFSHESFYALCCQDIVDRGKLAKKIVTHESVRLDQHSQVAFAPCHADAIEIFAQWHCEFPGCAEHVADLRHCQSLALGELFTYQSTHLGFRLDVQINVLR